MWSVADGTPGLRTVGGAVTCVASQELGVHRASAVTTSSSCPRVNCLGSFSEKNAQI